MRSAGKLVKQVAALRTARAATQDLAVGKRQVLALDVRQGLAVAARDLRAIVNRVARVAVLAVVVLRMRARRTRRRTRGCARHFNRRTADRDGQRQSKNNRSREFHRERAGVQ